MNTSAISFPIFGENFIFNPPSYFFIFGARIHFYGVIFALSFALAGLYIYRRREHFGITSDNVMDMIILAIIGGIVGARIYYVAFRPDLYFGAGNWTNIFRIQEGGLAIYGGIFGAVAAFLIYCRVKKLPITRLLDPGAFGLFIAQALGRWGNFFNREAFGVETTMPWAMGLQTATGTIYVHPAFLYESIWNILGLIFLHRFSKKVGRKYYGHYALIYIAWYGFGRFFIEGLRVDSLFIPGTVIRVSQMVALISFIAALAALIRNHVRGLNNILPAEGPDAESLPPDCDCCADDCEEAVSEDGEEPDSDDSEEPISDDSKEPVSDDSEEPVSDDSEEPVSDDSEEPVSNDGEQPDSEDSEEPDSEDSEEPESDDDNQEIERNEE